jgi:methylenetetrahydrofolate reductase (NADPH)
MMNTYYLVNVVHNDFHNRDAIFEPFFKVGAQTQAATPNGTKIQTNGNALDQLTRDLHEIAISSTA